MKRITRILAATIVGAVACVGGIVSDAAADAGPVRRVSCPSVAQINAIPTAYETRLLTTLVATPGTCAYKTADGEGMDFSFYPDVTTVKEVEDTIREQYAETSIPFLPSPVPALGKDAFQWGDGGPFSTYWELSAGSVAQMAVSLSWQGPKVISVAKLFRPMMEVYTIPGERTVNGRQWRTTCEDYSRTARCRTEIYATVIKKTATGYFKVNGWAFNSLTYRWSDRALWSTNPLGKTGSWTSAEGRKWTTECDTPKTGRGACRSYLLTTVIDFRGGKYVSENTWVFNNQVLFS